ncbi:MAG TPA: hypothetical protein VHE35_28960 [Kofleriaceae bacterium]|nr:hypothetical protein [Kofleriaceae bacterium]
MLIALGIVLLIAWIALKVVWHVATFGVHILLLAAAIFVVLHFVRGRSGSTTT